ncbi:MAG: energy transducer TonB [Bacteroidota bacterium]
MKNTIFVCFIFCMTFSVASNANTSINPNPVKPAAFIGGQQELVDYLTANLVYPECARKAAVEGKVVVSFFVLQDGSIHKPRVVKGLSEKCNQSVIDMINNMPNWTPATKDGKIMASKQSLTVDFQLESK